MGQSNHGKNASDRSRTDSYAKHVIAILSYWPHPVSYLLMWHTPVIDLTGLSKCGATFFQVIDLTQLLAVWTWPQFFCCWSSHFGCWPSILKLLNWPYFYSNHIIELTLLLYMLRLLKQHCYVSRIMLIQPNFRHINYWISPTFSTPKLLNWPNFCAVTWRNPGTFVCSFIDSSILFPITNYLPTYQQ